MARPEEPVEEEKPSFESLLDPTAKSRLHAGLDFGTFNSSMCFEIVEAQSAGRVAVG